MLAPAAAIIVETAANRWGRP